MRASLARMSSGGFPFKARIYYGEGKEDEKVLDEEDFHDAYGYEEIEDEDIKTFQHKPKRKVFYSDEQKEKIGERLKGAREKALAVRMEKKKIKDAIKEQEKEEFENFFK